MYNIADQDHLVAIAAPLTHFIVTDLPAEAAAARHHRRAGLLSFDLPPNLEASEPPEARGLTRDEVRLMVSYRRNNRVIHSQFRDLPNYLTAGDLVVINTSATRNAAIPVTRANGTTLKIHLSTHLPADLWVVELRQPAGTSTEPYLHAAAGESFKMPNGASVTLHTPYLPSHRLSRDAQVRLWVASLELPAEMSVDEYLAAHGQPIRYNYVKKAWPADYYQTVYALQPGSAEMPSAGRAFTPQLITQLVAQGIQVAPLVLHTGVASLEDHEPPYEEYYHVPPETAQLVNTTRSAGKRVVAVGTTVVRALETVTDRDGTTHPGHGWTGLVIKPEHGLRAVNAMLTGLHEPQASHLAMLSALAGDEHLKITYAEALAKGYLWHEFGDLHLILP